MGFFKWIKKKVSIKNLLKGAKAVLPFVPGGDLIKEGTNIASSTIGDLLKKKKHGNFPEPKTSLTPKNLPTETQIKTAVSGNKIFGFDPIILAGIAAIIFLAMRK